jgi:hypothetical protein
MPEIVLESVIDTLDGVDEAIKPFYKQLENGKYALQVKEAIALQNGLERERNISKELKAKLKAYDGIDLEKYKELQEREAAKEAEEAKKRGDYEKLVANLKGEHKKETDSLNAALAALQAERVNSFLDAQVTSAIAGAKGIPELLMPLIKERVKAEEKDGKLHLSVFGNDGQPRFKDGAGTAFTLDDLVSELRSDPKFGRAFEGSGATGGGNLPAGPGGAPSGSRARYDALNAKPNLTQAEGVEFVTLANSLFAEPQTNP